VALFHKKCYYLQHVNKKTLIFSALLLILIIGVSWWCFGGYFSIDNIIPSGNGEDKELPDPASLQRPENFQIGLNFIRFFFDEDEKNVGRQRVAMDLSYYQPDWIFTDFSDLGVQAFRQFVKADLLWNVIEPTDDQWSLEKTDQVIPNPNFEPIVTLFAMQYASATPPWITESSKFEKTLGPEAKEYLDKVIERYGPYVKYWEIGNEMDHWRAADPNNQAKIQSAEANLAAEEKIPVMPPGGFTPEEQGIFLAEAADYIRARDSDAVIVMPGMAGLSDYTLNTWLTGVLAGGGEFFDVVNYHFYSSSESFIKSREKFSEKLLALGLDDKPVWLTETGVTSDKSLTIRTDYPNSNEMQAAEIFRRIIPAYAGGDSFVAWHTYLSSSDEGSQSSWRAYGLRASDSSPKSSLYAFKLLTSELIPWSKVETLSDDPGGIMTFKITTADGSIKYVAWGKGEFKVPTEISEYTSVVPPKNGKYVWQKISAGQSIILSESPILIK